MLGQGIIHGGTVGNMGGEAGEVKVPGEGMFKKVSDVGA